MFGGQALPSMHNYLLNVVHADFSSQAPIQKDMEISPPIINSAFFEEL